MSRPAHNPHVHRFAVLCAAATLALIGLGGLVTSKGAGMAVPDWPTSYGYNMFLLPIGQWVGGVFYEHTHRLFAAFVGLLTSVLAAWLWARETTGRARWAGLGVVLLLVLMLGHRGSGNASGGAAGVPVHFKALAFVVPVLLAVGVVQCFRTGASLRWLGMTAFFAVIFQGILGGLRVALYKDGIGIFHATLAQGFLVLLCGIAWLTSRRWEALSNSRGREGTNLLEVRNPKSEIRNEPPPPRVARLFAGVTALILLQLVIGAAMRHQHAGLAIPDFPLAHGRLWPATDDASIQLYNQRRVDARDFNPITPFQIHLHMAHRLLALAILAAAACGVRRARRAAGAIPVVGKGALLWLGLMVVQAALGVVTVLKNKPADIATLHVVMGAASLSCGALLSLVAFRLERAAQFAGAQATPCVENAVASHGRAAVQGADGF